MVTGGAGVEVYGSGTGPDPYVISATTSTIAGTLEVTDTPTVDLTLGGSGSLSDPYDISAEVTLSSGDLTDAPTGTPDAGDVWIWDGTQFVWGPPSSGGGGATVVAGAGLDGDGSAADPLVLALTTGDGVSGAGTPASPLTVDAADWDDIDHTDDQTIDEGIPVYFSSTGQLLVPRGVYLWHIESGGEWDPDTNNLGPNLDTIYRNPGTLALGAHDDPVYRYLVIARRDSTVATRHGETEMYHTFGEGMSMMAMKVASTSERSDDGNPNARAVVTYLRRDGQWFVRSDATTEGSMVTRPMAFAQQQGSITTTGAANAVRAKVVTFAAGRFTTTPRVFVTIATGTTNAGSTNTEVWVTGVSTTSAQININRSNSTDVAAWWFAVQESSVAANLLQIDPESGHEGYAALPPTGRGVRSGTAPTGTAVCHTTICPNRDKPIEVPLPYTDEDGITYDPTYDCGVCGQPITDVS